MVWYAYLAQIAKLWYFPGGGWVAGWVVKSKIKLISAKAEAYASSLGLTELGNVLMVLDIPDEMIHR